MELQTQAHLHSIRQWLLYRQNELQAEVRAANEMRHDEEPGADVRDSKDDAEMRQRFVSEDSQLARDLAELQDVEDALSRLDAGTYGDCGHCGTAIPVARLSVQPAARLCASCQAALEKWR